MHNTVLWLALFVGIVKGLGGVVGLAVLLCIVMLHELGHAVVAQRYGVEVINITLFPFGGLAQMSIVPELPEQELAIALAGPGTNFLLALPGAALLLIMGLPLTSAPAEQSAALIWSLIWLWVAFNTAIGLFNLLPAFPLDGGRVLRALLVKKMGYLQATETAVRIGRYLAFLMFGAAIVIPNTGLGLAFIAIFIWIMGGRELIMVRLRHLSEDSNPLGRMFQFGGQAGPFAQGGPSDAGFRNPFSSKSAPGSFRDGDQAADAEFHEPTRGPHRPSIQIDSIPRKETPGGFSDEDVRRLEGNHGRLKRTDDSSGD